MRKEDYSQIRGTSTETKPIFADCGTEFFEYDTGSSYYTNGHGIWVHPNATPTTLSSIAVTTPPTKVNYKAGEKLSYAGMVVTATMSDSKTYAVDNYTVSIPEGTAIDDDETITITLVYNGTTKTTTQAINLIELSSITVTTAPTTTTYVEGNALDLTGIVVTASFDNSTTKDVTSECTFSPANGTVLTTSDTGVAISYTFEGTTKTTTQAITVNAKSVTSIAVKTAPTKTAYTSGETLTMAGLVLLATYDNGTTSDITYGTEGITYSPTEGSTVTEAGDVTITYATKTCTQAITIAE